MAEEKSHLYDDDGYKIIRCKNPKCRRYLTKLDTAGECKVELKCPSCGETTLYRIAQEKIVSKEHRSPGTN